MLKIEFQFLNFDELNIGIQLYYANDGIADMHITTFGFLFCELRFCFYLKKPHLQ